MYVNIVYACCFYLNGFSRKNTLLSNNNISLLLNLLLKNRKSDKKKKEPKLITQNNNTHHRRKRQISFHQIDPSPRHEIRVARRSRRCLFLPLGYLRLLALRSMQIQQQAVAVLFERTP